MKAMFKILYLINQPDFRANPLQAIVRRLLWRFHWVIHPHRPLILRRWWREKAIALPRSGSAAVIFYRKHSNVGIVRFMEEKLVPGMNVLDIGAHIGEYSLIAAYLVGQEGQVHAFEPQPLLTEMIQRNARLNSLKNIHVHPMAVGNQSGKVEFTFDQRTMGGLIARTRPWGANSLTVDCITLDQFVQEHRIHVHFIKCDAAGNERAVIEGGMNLFQKECPVIVCKLYHPNIVKERFDYNIQDTCTLLFDSGYDLFVALRNGRIEHLDSPSIVPSFFDEYTYGLPLLGFKKKREDL